MSCIYLVMWTWKSPGFVPGSPLLRTRKSLFADPEVLFIVRFSHIVLWIFNLKLKTHQKPRPGPGSPPLTSKIYKPYREWTRKSLLFFEPLPRAPNGPGSPLVSAQNFPPLPKEIKIFQLADNFRILVWLQNEKLHEWEGLPIPKRTYKSPFIFWGLSMAARLPQFAYAQTQH